MWIKMLIFAPKTMANDCTDIDIVLRQINQRLRKLEKSDSEKTEEIGRLNRVINQKDVEIHNLKTELAVAKERINELEEAADDTSSTPGKPEKNSSNSSIPPSQESIASREQRRTKSLRKPSGKPSGGQPGHKGHTLQTIAEPDVIVKHEPVYCKCCGRLLIDIPCQKIRKTQIVDRIVDNPCWLISFNNFYYCRSNKIDVNETLWLISFNNFYYCRWVSANSTSKCKITKCFCKSTPLVLRNSISFLVSH